MSKELKTGIIVVVTIGLFIWGYNFMKGHNIFKPNSRTFYVEYKNIQGLNKSSPVTINGYQVGSVSDIQFNDTDEKRGRLIVAFTLESQFEFSKQSIAKIYSASLLGGQSLAIIPKYKGEKAVDGDFLKGEVESDMFASVGEKLNPLQAKLENVIVSADSVLSGINQVFNDKTIQSIKRTVQNLEYTVTGINKTISSVNSLVGETRADLKITLANTKVVMGDLTKFSSNLATVDLNKIIKDSEQTLADIKLLTAKINNGDGTLGQLINDKKMYNNLTNATKQLEELLQDLKLNPKRYVHFSLFGKKAKQYEPIKE